MERPPIRYREKTRILWDHLKELGSGPSSLFMPGWTCLVVQLPVLYHDFSLGVWFTAHVNPPATIRGDEILIQLGSREHEEANTQNRRGHCKCILKALLIAARILFPDCEKILGMPLSHVNLSRYFFETCEGVRNYLVLIDLFIALIRLHGFLRTYYVPIPVEELQGNTWYPNEEIRDYIDQIAADERELLGRVQWDDDAEYENYAPSPGIYPDDALVQWTEADEQRFLTSFGRLEYFMGDDSIPPPLP